MSDLHNFFPLKGDVVPDVASHSRTSVHHAGVALGP